ncbi:hypothetical protein RB195_015008 [Necator americanus]|uniref:CHK kinase-like domain-containing protein n=1 Tax=Necator americanus TaxID=51031 RepID=A0ABR1E2J7_NECAM
MSKICLITPDWQTDSEKLPEKFVVKIPSLLSLVESMGGLGESAAVAEFPREEFCRHLESTVKKIHNNEVTFFRLLKKYNVSKVARPEVYYMREFSEENPSKAFIVMEYITGNLSLHIFDNVTPDDILQVLRTIAALQAASLKFTDEDKGLFLKDIFKVVFGQAFTKENVTSSLGLVRQFLSDRLEKSIDQVESIAMEVINLDFADNLSDTIGMKRVLCHGDVWSTNIIWKNGEKNVKLAALVDFQTSHFGCPATDIVRLLSACLSAKDRRENWEDLLGKFYCFLKEEVGNHEMPYTLEQLIQAYRRFFPFGAFMVFPMIAPMFQLANKSDDTEYKERVQKLIFEKTEGLLEDLVKFHEEDKNEADHGENKKIIE